MSSYEQPPLPDLGTHAIYKTTWLGKRCHSCQNRIPAGRTYIRYLAHGRLTYCLRCGIRLWSVQSLTTEANEDAGWSTWQALDDPDLVIQTAPDEPLLSISTRRHQHRIRLTPVDARALAAALHTAANRS